VAPQRLKVIVHPSPMPLPTVDALAKEIAMLESQLVDSTGEVRREDLPVAVLDLAAR
jgi:hypothetical protein